MDTVQCSVNTCVQNQGQSGTTSYKKNLEESRRTRREWISVFQFAAWYCLSHISVRWQKRRESVTCGKVGGSNTEHDVVWYLSEFLRCCPGDTRPVGRQELTHPRALGHCWHLRKATGATCSWSVLYVLHSLSPQNRAFTCTCFCNHGHLRSPCAVVLLLPQHAQFELLYIFPSPVGTQHTKWLLARVSSLHRTRPFDNSIWDVKMNALLLILRIIG